MYAACMLDKIISHREKLMLTILSMMFTKIYTKTIIYGHLSLMALNRRQCWIGISWLVVVLKIAYYPNLIPVGDSEETYY